MGVRAHRCPKPRRKRGMWGKAPANAASVRGLAAARAALVDGVAGPTGEDALAVLEQRRVEVTGGRQPSLNLGPGR